MRRLPLVTIAAAALAGLALPARASASIVVAGPGSYIAGYTTPVVVTVKPPGACDPADAPQNCPLPFANADIDFHDVVADGVYGLSSQPWCGSFPAGRCPLFWSPLIGGGNVTQVRGLENASAPAVYPFYCTIHPWMTGRLAVVGTG